MATPTLPDYAELHCRSNFSFLQGASHPEELVARAAALGYQALAIADECSLAGVVRAHAAVRELARQGQALQLLIGSEMAFEGEDDESGGAAQPGCRLVLLSTNREGYGDLSELITRARMRSAKGDYRALLTDLDGGLPHCLVLWLPGRTASPQVHRAQAGWLRERFGGRLWVGVHRLLHADDDTWVARLRPLADRHGLPLAAAGAVRMHVRSRKPLLDVLTAIRLGRPVHACGHALTPNAEPHLRSRLQLAGLYPAEWLAETVRIAQRCRFSLDELRYEYPQEIVPPGETAASHLCRLTWDGAARLYPQGVPAAVAQQLHKELALIEELHYEAYFLTVHDLVAYARSQGILCQGRGSAANSAVCYCLGITAVDPARASLLFERFISRERGEPPDIDVDFEHQRREEVIHYIYAKYGRERTALAAAVATYRTRGAVREVGKALGIDAQRIDAVAKSHQWFDAPERTVQSLAEHGFDTAAPVTQQWVELAAQLMGFPRHLSQHSGGFVIARDKLSRLVPIENAAMQGRSVIQWDKDDLESLGLLKVDVLALGMLSALRRALDLMAQRHGRPFALTDIPPEDPATYAMIRRADTIGVFQIESRAQQSMLPRLQPRTFYDLVVQVAIVRPGPIQGGMVHPYLRRRQGLEPAGSPDPALDAALGRTLGVPIFQEQVMQIAMIAAGFSADEADSLRRAMAAWRRKGGVHHFHARIVQGMTQRGYQAEFAESIFRQIQGFGEYGFPESHAASFALLAYASAWVKCHEPAIFLAALLNSLPMGFYGPSQLVQDARRHGVEVRPVDVLHSDWDCTLEHATPTPCADARAQDGHPAPPAPAPAPAPTPAPAPAAPPAVRLGLRLVEGLGEDAAQRLVQARRQAPWASVQDLARRARLDTRALQTLAAADALRGLAGHRREQTWAVAAPSAGGPGSVQGVGPGRTAPLLADAPVDEPACALPEAPEGEAIVHDYAATGLTLRRHPLALLRPALARRGVRSAQALAALGTAGNGRLVRACGIVTMRQQPATAKGTIFVTLEDETGQLNVIVWPRVRDACRRALLGARLMAVHGQWQSHQGVQHLVARSLDDWTTWLGRLDTTSRDFR